MFARAAETFRRLGDAANAANADYNRAEVLVRQGRSDEALPLLQNTLRVARAVGDEDLVALVRKEMGRAQSRAGDVPAGLILLEEARTELTRLREPQEVVDADIASAEAHLLAGRPEQALALIEGALTEAASIHAATLLPSAYRVQAAALFAMGEVVQARTALAEGLRQSSSPDVAHERGFLLAVAARIARQDHDPDADRLAEQAREALELLGVVRVPLPESPAELDADPDVVDEEEGQVEVAIVPVALHIIDAGLLPLANYALLRARRRHLVQRTGVVQGVEHRNLGHAVRISRQRALSHARITVAGSDARVERLPVGVLEIRDRRNDQGLSATCTPTVAETIARAD